MRESVISGAVTVCVMDRVKMKSVYEGIRSWLWVTFLLGTFLVLPVCGEGPTDTRNKRFETLDLQKNPPPMGSNLQVVLAVSDLSVGPNRLAFGLIESQQGPLSDADVTVSTFFLTNGVAEGPREEVKAVFQKWPTGPGGIYTAQISFDRADMWGIGLVVTEPDGSTRTASTRLQVREKSRTPAIASPAPRSVNKTIRDVNSLEELTTDLDPDEKMYVMTIDEAINTGNPLVVTFSTPAFCQTAICGPQLEVIKELRALYSTWINFVHIEIYDNPHEIQGDFSQGRLSPSVAEWSLPSEPWTFIVDGEGLVYAKFEGFATQKELEARLNSLLSQ